MKIKKHFNKRKATLSFLATGLMIIWACVAMLPFAFMFCSSLKPGEEMLRKGLSLTIEPGISSFSNYNAGFLQIDNADTADDASGFLQDNSPLEEAAVFIMGNPVVQHHAGDI